MKKLLINYGGVILFYIVIVLGIIFMNYDTDYLQKDKSISETQSVYVK